MAVDLFEEPKDLFSDSVEPEPSILDKGIDLLESYGEFGLGLGETALSMTTGFAAMPVSGLVGLYDLATDRNAERSAGSVRAIQEAMTYAPRTESGKTISTTVGKFIEGGLELAGEGAAAVAPEEYELEAEAIGRGTAEAVLMLAPFAPKGISKLKSKKAQKKAVDIQEQAVAVKKQQITEKRSFKDIAEDLASKESVEVQKATKDLLDTTIKEAVPPKYAGAAKSASEGTLSASSRIDSSVPEGLAPDIMITEKGPVTLPKKSRFGEIVDSPYLRAEQQFPNSTIPMELRLMESNRAIKMSERDGLVESFHKLEKGMSKKEKKQYKKMWLNQDMEGVKSLSASILGKEKATKLWDEYQKAIDIRFDEMKAAGMAMEKIPNYLPRMVTDYSGFKKKFPTKLQAKFAKLEEDFSAGKVSPAEFSIEMNRIITAGGSTFIKRPTSAHAKERVIQKASALEDMYSTPAQALRNYFNETGSAVAERQFLGFGKTVEESIGFKLASEVQKGNISPTQASELRKVLESRFGSGAQQTSHKFVSNLKDIGYIGTIGDMGSAITQFGDLAASFGRHGALNTTRALMQAALPRSMRKKTVDPLDVGIGEIMQEMVGNPSKMKTFLDKTLKYSGFKLVDRFGKRTILTAAKNKYQKWASTPRGIKKLEKKGYKALFDKIGEGQWEAFLKDMKAGDISNPNVRFAVVNELAEVQPIFMIDMPMSYLKHPNGRIVYALKTWAIRQVNRLREDMMKGQYGDLARYALAIYIGNLSIDLMKDATVAAIHGEELTQRDISNRALANMFKLALANQGQVKKAARGDVSGMVADFANIPAFGMMGDVVYDIKNWDDAEKRIKTISRIPVIGRGISAYATPHESRPGLVELFGLGE